MAQPPRFGFILADVKRVVPPRFTTNSSLGVDRPEALKGVPGPLSGARGRKGGGKAQGDKTQQFANGEEGRLEGEQGSEYWRRTTPLHESKTAPL